MLSFNRWVFNQNDKVLAQNLAQECDIDDFLALICCGRGLTDPFLLDMFLSNEPVLSDYSEIKDIFKAKERILKAIQNNEKIAVFGDYDCDGITATVLMYKFLKELGANVITYIPSRQDDGYGMSIPAIDKLNALNVKLIVTVDNGIAANAEIDYANSLNIDTIITDHHLPQEKLPNAVAIVDPHRKDDPFNFKGLAGVGVAFALALIISEEDPEIFLYNYAELLCIGTITDIMPLLQDNRTFVKIGLEKINNGECPEILNLLKTANCQKTQIDSRDIGFVIGPRINAAGRMSEASIALELFLNQSNSDNISKKLEQLNTIRQETEGNIIKDATEQIQKNNLYKNRVIIAKSKDWHEGVLGIAAAKLVTLYKKPVILLKEQDGFIKGSGRSLGGFSLFNALFSIKELLYVYGGHSMAAGVTIKAENFETFVKGINNYANKQEKPFNELKIDCKLNPLVLNLDLLYAIQNLEPYGTANPEPLFAVVNLKIDNIVELSSGKHIKIYFSKNNCKFSAIMFNKSKKMLGFSNNDIVDIVIILKKNIYQNKESLSIIIKDIRETNFNEENYINEILLLEALENNNLSSLMAEQISPTREEIVFVYKQALINGSVQHLINHIKLPKAKIIIILKILQEIGVINIKNGEVFKIEGVKSDLEKSALLQLIKGVAKN